MAYLFLHLLETIVSSWSSCLVSSSYAAARHDGVPLTAEDGGVCWGSTSNLFHPKLKASETPSEVELILACTVGITEARSHHSTSGSGDARVTSPNTLFFFVECARCFTGVLAAPILFPNASLFLAIPLASVLRVINALVSIFVLFTASTFAGSAAAWSLMEIPVAVVLKVIPAWCRASVFLASILPFDAGVCVTVPFALVHVVIYACIVVWVCSALMRLANWFIRTFVVFQMPVTLLVRVAVAWVFALVVLAVRLQIDASMVGAIPFTFVIWVSNAVPHILVVSAFRWWIWLSWCAFPCVWEPIAFVIGVVYAIIRAMMSFAFTSCISAFMVITVPLTIEIVVINAIVVVGMLTATSCSGSWWVSTSLTRSIPEALVLWVSCACNFTLMVSASRSKRHASLPFAIPLTVASTILAWVHFIVILARSKERAKIGVDLDSLRGWGQCG